MAIDFYKSGIKAPLGIKPSKVVITIDCSHPGVSPIWQAEVGAQLEEMSKLMLTDQSIPRVLRDGEGGIVGSIEIN